MEAAERERSEGTSRNQLDQTTTEQPLSEGVHQSSSSSITFDVEAHQREAVALRESEAWFHSIADSTPMLIWMSGPQKEGLYFNEAWLTFTGMPVEEQLAGEWLALVHDGDRDALTKICLASFQKREPFTAEFRLRRADGAYRWMLDTGKPRFDINGTFLGFIGSCVDITERRRIEAMQRENEQRLRLALEAGRMGAWEWSISDNAVTWSPTLEAIHGLEPGAFAGTFEAYQNDIHPDDRAQVLASIEHTLKTGGDHHVEYRIICPDGSLRWVEGRGKLYRDADGSPLRMIGVCIDITARKRNEEHMQTVMAELNHRVKNTLAVVQGLASQTIASSRSLESFGENFTRRLRSIATAHRLLTESEWEGAPLAQIIESETESLGVSGDRTSIKGPPLILRPRIALALHMVVHELATNACRHGGLQAGDGRADVEWLLEQSADGTALVLTWIERCATELPASVEEGYGSRLIDQLVTYELRGHATRRYARSGLQCQIRVPLE